MAIRAGHVVAFLFGIAVGVALGWFAGPRHAALRPMDAHSGSGGRPDAALVTPTDHSSPRATAEVRNPFSVDLPEPVIMAASPGDVRLELRSAVGGLLEGTSLHGGHVGISDDEVFLAAWEKLAADDRRPQSTSDVDSLHRPSQPLRKLTDPVLGEFSGEREIKREVMK